MLCRARYEAHIGQGHARPHSGLINGNTYNWVTLLMPVIINITWNSVSFQPPSLTVLSMCELLGMILIFIIQKLKRLSDLFG